MSRLSRFFQFFKRLAAFFRKRPTTRPIRHLLPRILLLLLVMVVLPLAVYAAREEKEPKNPTREDGAIYVDASATDTSDDLPEESPNKVGAGTASGDVSEIGQTAKNEPVSLLQMERHADGSVVALSMEDYLTGVLLAEIPSSYDAQALMAQAVAARTYCLYRITGNASRHASGADVCDDYSHCMAYIDPAKREPSDSEPHRLAVQSTAGVVCLYNGNLIDAVFHDSSYLYTESSLAVWGSDIPYLQAVPSYETLSEKTYTFTAAQIFSSLSLTLPSSASAAPFGGILPDAYGRASELIVYGEELSALKLRLSLGLPSTSFSVTYDSDTQQYTFRVRGYGHGVGLSQQGAQAMALDGFTYPEILRHYYTGCTVSSWTADGVSS